MRQVHPAPLDLPGLPEVPLARPDLLAQLAQPERQARLVQRELSAGRTAAAYGAASFRKSI